MADLDKSKKDSSEGFNDDKRDIEEKEKRILYVSLTRTRQVVFLYYKYTKNHESEISSFVKDFNTKVYEAKGFRKTLV